MATRCSMAAPTYTEFEWHTKSAGNGVSGEKLTHVFVDLVKKLDGVRSICDLGCGNGWLSEQYRLAGYAVTGVDRSEDGLTLAAAAFPCIEFRKAEIGTDLGGPFDCIVSTEVIEHLYSPATMLARCFDALRPGGTLVITTLIMAG